MTDEHHKMGSDFLQYTEVVRDLCLDINRRRIEELFQVNDGKRVGTYERRTLSGRSGYYFMIRLDVSKYLGKTIYWLLTHLRQSPSILHYYQWHSSVANLYGDIWNQPKVKEHFLEYSKKLSCNASPKELLFILQTLYSILARIVVFYRLNRIKSFHYHSSKELLQHLATHSFYEKQWGVSGLLPDLLTDGYLSISVSEREFENIFRPVLSFAQYISEIQTQSYNWEIPWANLLTNLYQTIIPRPIRHDIGEYFTPYWLAQKTIEMAGFTGDLHQVVFDPGCGSGIFWVASAEMKYQANQNMAQPELLKNILRTVMGCDISPLSVLSARLNLVMWLASKLGLPLPEVELPILHYDTVFETGTKKEPLDTVLSNGCDYLVGNPPWISWNCLPTEYRRRLEEQLLPKYVLFDFQGQQAQLGHSNDDYLVTFTLVTIHRYLKPKGIANETAIIVLRKGQKTTYPVPYEIWLKKNGEVAIRPQKAKPANSADLTSSWVVLTPELHRTQFMEGRGPYEIRHGLKHDVAEILIVQPVERQGHQLIIEQTNNLRERYEIETEVIYPFLQPRHLHKWKIGGNTYVIIPQQKAGEDNEKELEKKLPLTYSYLKHFEAHFTKRRSRLFSNGPFYGLLGLGDYTWKPDEVFKTSCVYRFGKSNNLNRREGQNFG